MNIINVIIVRNLQYFILSAIIIFAILSLFIVNIRKKFIFLFFFYLFTQIYYFTLYLGNLFFLLFIPVILFMLTFYLYNIHIETYFLKNIYNLEIYNKENFSISGSGIRSKEKLEAKKIYSVVIPVLLILGFIFLFFKFSGNYTAKFDAAKSITLINFSIISNEIFFNYAILIFLLILLIFILFLWMISIILIKRKH